MIVETKGGVDADGAYDVVSIEFEDAEEATDFDPENNKNLAVFDAEWPMWDSKELSQQYQEVTGTYGKWISPLKLAFQGSAWGLEE